jgi:hypothetical protein
MGLGVESAVGFMNSRDREDRLGLARSSVDLREAVQGTRGTHVVP